MIFWKRPRGLEQFHSHSDEALCREVLKGNHEAFLVLFDRYWQQVFRVAHSVIRDQAEAEDLAQTLFLEVHTSMLRFDEQKGSFRTLLLRYAYTRAIDHRRRLESRRFYSNVEFEDVNPAILAEDSALASGLSMEEGTRLIEQAMKQLDERQRATVEAYFFQGLSLNEIAHQQGDSFGNVRHHLYRGLEKMRKLFTAKEQAEDSTEPDRSARARLPHSVPKRLAPEVSVVRARTI
ncbi:MAG TPA: sigma-70 family RNA polymerase sigma factor [Candidatus Acidoferrum sp.]|nr:sigma-70 family RNA polymerase sigma factor [Candidatus Acidoferrum sp.]